MGRGACHVVWHEHGSAAHLHVLPGGVHVPATEVCFWKAGVLHSVVWLL
jgi:hypothetical protein